MHMYDKPVILGQFFIKQGKTVAQTAYACFHKYDLTLIYRQISPAVVGFGQKTVKKKIFYHLVPLMPNHGHRRFCHDIPV